MPTRTPLPALVVIAGSCGLSAVYYAQLVWSAAYLPWFGANVGLAVAAGLLTAALDALKPLFMKASLHHWRNSRWGFSGATALLALLLALVSMWAIDGVLMRIRSDGTNPAANALSAHTRKDTELRKAETDLKALGPSRPVAEIAAAMGKAPINLDVFRRTGQCTDITKEESRTACLPLLTLREEMARANKRLELEQTIGTTRAWLDANPKPASADPQIDTYAKLTGTSDAFIALLITATLGLALELVSLFGPVLLELREEHRPSPSVPAPRAEPIDITPVEVKAPAAVAPPTPPSPKRLIRPVRQR
ncbi:MAG: hypothetical protein ABL901_10040 [Hyphomicrobiaceae bacterium]